jgi:cytochrome c oxidase assembly protein subunit 15
MNDDRRLRRFRRVGLITILATVFLIWVGGWVRSTGSGMGCPDWPKCFGTWIPPTAESQLPPDYAQHYVALRQKKNARVAKVLAALGFSETAEKLKNDPSVWEHEPFNAYKTWTEYVNRLVGVLVGFLIFLTVVFAYPLRRYDKRIFRLAVLGFIGVAFEGWLGSLVVSTNLMPSFITVHMVVALLILMVLIAAVLIATKTIGDESDALSLKPMGLIWGGIGLAILILIQIIVGTQVRENVDEVAALLGEAERQNWVAALGTAYTIHRFFYYIVAVAIMYWVWILRGHSRFKQPTIKPLSLLLLSSLILEIFLGIGMHRWAIPPVFQSLHLLFGTLLFALTVAIVGRLYLRGL